MPLRKRAWRFFNYFAPVYEWLVRSELWGESVREIARHLPPSGARLRVLDVGCGPANSAITLANLRADVTILGLDRSRVMLPRAVKAIARGGKTQQITVGMADATQLPLHDNSIDAVFLHSVYYMLDEPAAFLAEAWRVLRPGGRLIMLDPAVMRFAVHPGVLLKNPRAVPSLLTWQLVSYGWRRFTPESIARELEAAGFARVLGERAVQGYGILSRGEKPYPTQNPAARQTYSDPAQSNDALIPVTAASALDGTPSRNLFLLIRQEPDKPAWTLQPGEVVTWGAASALHEGQPVALAFTSLPKGVAFMQPAVNLLKGVTKVAKFPRDTAQSWDFSLLINPTLDALQAAPGWTLPGPFIGVDPLAAVTGEE